MACMLTNPQMMRATFGSCMNAASSCAISAAVDAIFVASIIIIRRVNLAILGNSLLQLVLLLRKIGFRKSASVENVC